jgi:hypothetical protein
VGEALVELVAVALKGDERVGVAGDGLDQLDVGTGCDEAADAGVSEVVEAVAGFAVWVGEFGMAERGLPDAAVEVGGVEGAAGLGLEDQLLGGIAAALDRARRELVEGVSDAGEEGDVPDAGRAFRSLELVA